MTDLLVSVNYLRGVITLANTTLYFSDSIHSSARMHWDRPCTVLRMYTTFTLSASWFLHIAKTGEMKSTYCRTICMQWAHLYTSHQQNTSRPRIWVIINRQGFHTRIMQDLSQLLLAIKRSTFDIKNSAGGSIVGSLHTDTAGIEDRDLLHGDGGLWDKCMHGGRYMPDFLRFGIRFWFYGNYQRDLRVTSPPFHSGAGFICWMFFVAK